MLKQVSFMFNGQKYYTVFNYDFARNNVNKGGNAVVWATMAKNVSIMRSYSKYNNGISYNDTPELQDAQLIDDNGNFSGTGWVEYDGVIYDVALKHNSIEFITRSSVDKEEPEQETVIETEPEPEQETVVKQKPEEKVIVEQEPEPEPEPVQQPVKGYLSSTDPRRKATSKGMQRGVRNPNAVPMHLELGVPIPARGVIFGATVTPRQTTAKKNNNKKLRQQNNAPIQGNTPTWTPRNRTTEPIRAQNEFVQPPEPKVEMPVKEPEPAVVVREPETPVVATDQESPSPVQQLELAPDIKVVKAGIRAKLSDDAAAIIGDVPLDLLGSIVEYSPIPVDMQVVRDGGDIYLLEHRWHKCGKWFGIDDTTNVSRVIVNTSRQIYTSIPINICKEWVTAVTENKNGRNK